MIRIVATLWTAIVAIAAMAVAIYMLWMPGSIAGPALGLLGCGVLMMAVGVGLVAEGTRRPHVTASGAAILASSAERMPSLRATVPKQRDVSRSVPAKPQPPATLKPESGNRSRADIRAGEKAF